MTAKTSLQDSYSEAADAALPSRDAWAQMDRATIEATIRVLANRGIGETFLAMMSNLGIEGVRRVLGNRT